MTTASAKQLEITRHTIRRFAIWHVARWFFVPAFVLAASIGGSAIALGSSPWEELRILDLPSQDLLTIVAVSSVALIVGVLFTRAINRSKVGTVIAICAVLFAITVLTWAIALMNCGDDVIFGTCIASLIGPFALYVITYSFRANNAAWLTQLSEADRASIDEAARRI